MPNIIITLNENQQDIITSALRDTAMAKFGKCKNLEAEIQGEMAVINAIKAEQAAAARGVGVVPEPGDAILAAADAPVAPTDDATGADPAVVALAQVGFSPAFKGRVAHQARFNSFQSNTEGAERISGNK